MYATGPASYSCLLRHWPDGGGVDVTEHRKRTDWANQIKRLVDEDFPDAEKIVLVMDNLNTHP
ncbi:MAG: hypothetical protein LBQ54_10390 [Planctomycetaceae bacterium]|jgi:hypothetical protein|nr:hypothetical protein [Planctomycetaceae bacterium]